MTGWYGDIGRDEEPVYEYDFNSPPLPDGFYRVMIPPPDATRIWKRRTLKFGSVEDGVVAKGEVIKVVSFAIVRKIEE